jgi:hypothetical protein
MAIYSDPQLNSKPVHLGQYGEANAVNGQVQITANFTTADKARVCKIPGGMEVSALIFGHGDVDTGSNTLTVNVGYEPVDTSLGPTADPTAFASADAGFAAASAGRVLANFVPVKFDNEVYLTLIPAASGNALGAAANIRCTVIGRNVGVK